MSNYCKYYRQQKYMSIDGGITWTPLQEYQKGRLIERNSDECGYVDPIYRTITSEPYCSGETGYDKYVNELSQVSYNNGASWITTATTPILIEQWSQDCGYVPMTKWERITPTSDPDTYICEDCSYVRAKWVATYTDSHVESAECDSTSAITNGEIDGTNLLDIQIGSCVTTIGQAAFDWCRSLTSVTIPDSVTIIGDESFWYCTSLENLRIGSGVTTIEEGAFAVCYSLTSVTIPDSVTSIGQAAFDKCSGLTSVTIPDSVTSIGSQAFGGCTSLTSLTISSNITNIGNFTFYNCSGLTSIVIPDNVTSIGVAAFDGCISLTSVTIPDSVTTIKGSAFEYCSGLTSCTIGSGVTSIEGQVFRNCSGLTSVTINSVTPPTLASTNAFENTNNCPIYVQCGSVNAYKSASGWASYASRIQGIPPCSEPTPTFDGKWLATYSGGTTSSAECDSTSAITSGEVTTANLVSVSVGECVTSIGVGAFKSCTSLTSIDIPNSVAYIDQNVFYNCTSLSSITIGSGVRSIGNGAFGRCSGLTSITIPNSITRIGSNAFYESRLITMNSGTNGVFNLPSSVGGYAFYGCSGMANLILGNNATSIGTCAFKGCSNLRNVTIPSSVTKIGNNAFNNTPWYRRYSADTSNQYGNIIYINDVAYEAVSTSITSCTFKSGTISISDYAFSKCSGLTNVTIPNSVTTIGIEAFRNCSGLTNVTIPSSVTRIGNSAFLNAPWYRSYSADTSNQYNNVVYINDIAYEAVSTSITSCTFKNGAVVIGDKAFYNCSSLTSVTIPNSITTIGYDAFYNCTSLSSITIGSGVRSIGNGAFDWCRSLTSVTIEASTPPVIEDDIFNQSYSVVIYVPDASVDAYKTAKGWNRYASRIQAIP